LLFSVVALLFGAPAGNAALLTKELTHVMFEDGGSATGSLVLDTTLNQVKQFDIRTTPGSSIDSVFEYRSDTARIAAQSNRPGGGWPNCFLQLVSLPEEAGSVSHELFLTFSSPLTAEQPSAILYHGGLGTSSYEHEFLGQHLQELRSVIGPQVVSLTSVPEPSQLMWLAVSIALMCWRFRPYQFLKGAKGSLDTMVASR
jgi:hypothetical protein